jgi:hypothetical protein
MHHDRLQLKPRGSLKQQHVLAELPARRKNKGGQPSQTCAQNQQHPASWQLR